jgi:hypothetical protein
LGKLKKKSHSEDEHYRGQIRDLQKQVRTLQQELRTYRKRENLYENNKEEIQELLTKQDEIEVKKVAACPKCFEGKLNLVLDLNDKDIFSCDSCDFKKTVKK